jgi:hypothetical protein
MSDCHPYIYSIKDLFIVPKRHRTYCSVRDKTQDLMTAIFRIIINIMALDLFYRSYPTVHIISAIQIIHIYYNIMRMVALFTKPNFPEVIEKQKEPNYYEISKNKEPEVIVYVDPQYNKPI